MADKENIRKLLTIAGVTLASSYLGSQLFLEKRVATLFEQEMGKPRVEMKITTGGQPLDIPEMFSGAEQFVPSTSGGFLESKRGFMYEHRVTAADTDRFGALVTSTYTFSTSDWGVDVKARLSIANSYIPPLRSKTIINLYDTDFDGNLDNISMGGAPSSGISNNNSTIIRLDSGALKLINIDEKGAKEAYDYLTTLYREFIVEHEIERRLREYTPKLDIELVPP